MAFVGNAVNGIANAIGSGINAVGSFVGQSLPVVGGVLGSVIPGIGTVAGSALGSIVQGAVSPQHAAQVTAAPAGGGSTTYNITTQGAPTTSDASQPTQSTVGSIVHSPAANAIEAHLPLIIAGIVGVIVLYYVFRKKHKPTAG